MESAVADYLAGNMMEEEESDDDSEYGDDEQVYRADSRSAGETAEAAAPHGSACAVDVPTSQSATAAVTEPPGLSAAPSGTMTTIPFDRGEKLANAIRQYPILPSLVDLARPELSRLIPKMVALLHLKGQPTCLFEVQAFLRSELRPPPPDELISRLLAIVVRIPEQIVLWVSNEARVKLFPTLADRSKIVDAGEVDTKFRIEVLTSLQERINRIFDKKPLSAASASVDYAPDPQSQPGAGFSCFSNPLWPGMGAQTLHAPPPPPPPLMPCPTSASQVSQLLPVVGKGGAGTVKVSEAALDRNGAIYDGPKAAPVKQFIEAGGACVIILNLPPGLTQKDLLIALNENGFKDKYIFCYIPSPSQTNVDIGGKHAFVNFIDEHETASFIDAWNGTRRFGMAPSEPALRILTSSGRARTKRTHQADAAANTNGNIQIPRGIPPAPLITKTDASVRASLVESAEKRAQSR
jgi:hypothetical protein